MKKTIVRLLLALFIATSAVTFVAQEQITTVEAKKATKKKKVSKKKKKSSKKKSKKKTSKKKKKHVHKWEYCNYVEPAKGGTYEGKEKTCKKCGETKTVTRKFVKCIVVESSDEDQVLDISKY